MKKLCITVLLTLCAQITQEAVLPEVNCSLPTEAIEEFTPYKLQEYILSKEIKHPHIAYAQAMLETGWFTSRIFRENHNLFGMKKSQKRESTALGERYNHAYYKHWKESVDDYLLWQQMFKITPIDTEKEYFALLGKRYAEDKQYVSTLHTIISKDTTRWIRYKPPQSKSLGE